MLAAGKQGPFNFVPANFISPPGGLLFLSTHVRREKQGWMDHHASKLRGRSGTLLREFALYGTGRFSFWE